MNNIRIKCRKTKPTQVDIRPTTDDGHDIFSLDLYIFTKILIRSNI